MQTEQVLALILMGAIAIVGMPYIFEAHTKGWRNFGYAWVVFWGLPPLARIWVAAIFGV